LENLECGMQNELKKLKYKSDTSWVLDDVSEEENKKNFCLHSERYALAYALLITPPGKTIYLYTKNLRVCGDCHETTKLFAKIFTIVELWLVIQIVFHHFEPNATCSCDDI